MKWMWDIPHKGYLFVCVEAKEIWEIEGRANIFLTQKNSQSVLQLDPFDKIHYSSITIAYPILQLEGTLGKIQYAHSQNIH